MIATALLLSMALAGGGAEPPWVEHDLGWAVVRVPRGWIATARCGPEVAENPACGCARSAAEFQDGDGAFLVVALDRDGCGGGTGGWTLALAPEGDRVRVMDAPAPRCFTADGVPDETGDDCADPTVLVTAAAVAGEHGFTFQLGHEAGADAFDAALFGRIVEAARLAPRAAVAAHAK